MSDFTNILLNNTSDVDKLLSQAESANMDVRLTPEGTLKLHALKKTPETVKLTNQFTQMWKSNKQLVRYAITKKGWPDVFNPPSIADKLSGMIPDTGAGQMALGAQLGLDFVAPEAGIPLQLLTSTLGGIGGGLLNKEPLGGAMQTGLVSGATNLGLKGLTKGVKYLGQSAKIKGFMGHASQLERDAMAKIGTVVKNALKQYGVKSLDRLATDEATVGQPNQDTVLRWLNGKTANEEISKIQEGTKKTVIGEIIKDAQDTVAKLTKSATHNFGFPPGKVPQNFQFPSVANKKAYEKAVEEIDKAAEEARTIGPEVNKAFEEIGGLGRSVYDLDGELKNSYPAAKGAKTRRELMNWIDERIQQADPESQKGLAKMLEDKRDLYSKFSGFKDFVNIDKIAEHPVNALQKNGQWFNSQVLQKAVDAQTNPAVRFLQARLKDAFEPLYTAVRRNATPLTEKGAANIADQPLFGGESIRAVSHGPLGRMAARIPIPRMLGHYIGETGIKPVAQQAAGKLPVLLNAPATKLGETPVQTDEGE